MALTYNQISGITRDRFIPKLYDNIFIGNPLLMRAKDKGWYRKIGGGNNVLIPLEYAQLTANGWYQGAETLDTSDNETFTAASYSWKQNYANITISRRDELINSGDSQIIDLVKSKTKNAEKTVRQNLTEALYSDGSDPKSPTGLQYHISTTNSPGGIDQSTNSWWQPGTKDTTTSTLTISAMQTIFNACSEDNEAPSVIVGDKTRYNLFYNLLQPQQRFVDTKMASAGFTSIMFNGIPFISDTNAPSQWVMFLNENHLHFLAHEDEDMRFEPFAKPTNQNLKLAKIYWMGVFGSSNTRFQGAMTAITG